MKRALYKLLWLDDNHLERHARLFGWINLFLGGSAIVGAVILYTAISGQLSETTTWLGELSGRLAPSDNLRERDVQAASKMLSACSKLITPMPMWASGMLAVIGVLAALQGVMYIRIKEILDRK